MTNEKISEKISSSRLRAVAVTMVEDGLWIRWERYDVPARTRIVHAILFEDGSIWDAVNGWREQDEKTMKENLEFLREFWRREDERAFDGSRG